MLTWTNEKDNPDILSMETIEEEVKREKQLEKQKLSPKEWWEVFNTYMKNGDETLLNKLAECNYPQLNALISTLGYDFQRRHYYNEQFNHISQASILYNRKELLRLLKALHDEGGFVFIPRKDYQEFEVRYKEKYPWLNGQELEILSKLKPLNDKVTKEKVKKSKQQKPSSETSQTNSEQTITNSEDKLNPFTICDMLTAIYEYDEICKERNCPHYGQPSAPYDIRYPDKPVDILILGEAPHTEEVKPENQKPFVGRSGQLLRKHILDKLPEDINYVIWNSSMCKVTDVNKNKNLKVAIDICRYKLFEVIRSITPKVIIALGSSAYYALFKKDVVIGKENGIPKPIKVVDYYCIVITTYHPASLLYDNQEAKLESMKYAFNQAYIHIKQRIQTPIINVDSTKPQFFDQHVIDKHLMLLDIQDFDDEIVYVFKDKNNKKYIERKSYDNRSPIFYYYVPKDKKITKPFYNINECDIVTCKNLNEYKEAKYSNIGLHSDLYIATRHAIDYYQFAKSHNIDQNYNLHIGFLDIEVTPEDRKTFPDELTTPDPITAISYASNKDNIIHTWVLVDINIHSEKEISELNHIEHCYVFTDEKKLLTSFLQYVQKDDPDIIAGWNIYFDLNYICRRAEKIGIKNWAAYLSPIGKVTIDSTRSFVHIGARIVCDMLMIYKQLTYGMKDSYALQAIATYELGYGKYEFEGTLLTIYDKNVIEFVKYNKQDVQILIDLEKKLNYIPFMDELRQLLQGTWLSLVSTSAICDCMLVSYLENRGLVTKPKSYQNIQMQFKGAFVYTPQPGIRKWVFDLDYSSLYPNIIRTFNIGIDTFAAVISEKDAEDIIFNRYKKSTVTITLNPLFNDKSTQISYETFKKNLENKWLLTPCGSIFLRQSVQRGILYDLMTMLLEERDKGKKLKAKYKAEGNNDLAQRYHNIQWRYKIIANSFYGYLGFQHSRMYDRRVAAAITSVGRHVAKSGIISASEVISQYCKNKTSIDRYSIYTKDEVKVPHVIYSDTDSIISTLENIDRVINDNFIHNELPKIETEIDERTRQIMIDMFNLEECYFKLKVEWIAYKMLQVAAKKRYAFMRYPDKDIEIVGMESKKSDQPPILREWLKNLVEYILKSDNITRDDLVKYIKKYADEYVKVLKTRVIEAGKPMTANLNNLNLPQGRAAQLWNDLEYGYFNNDVKGYYFVLKGVDTTKRPDAVGRVVKDILVPFEVNKLPEYYLIDYSSMVSKYWTKKALAIVESIAPGIERIINQTVDNRVVGIASW